MISWDQFYFTSLTRTGNNTLILTHFVGKTIFSQRVWGVYIKLVEFWRGGGLIFVFKKWKFRGGGGTHEMDMGYGYFLELVFGTRQNVATKLELLVAKSVAILSPLTMY